MGNTSNGVGNYGDPKIKNKGENLLNLVKTCNVKEKNTFFEYQQCLTWKDFSRSKQKHQIDHSKSSHKLFTLTNDYKVSHLGLTSNHY